MYARISNLDRNRLITAFEADEDWVALARQLGIKYQTARSIIIRFEETEQREGGQRGGARNVRLSPEMKAFLIDRVERKCTITLTELNGLLRIEFPNRPVSIQTISRALDGELLTLKLLRNVPVQWNTPAVKAERREFMTWLTNPPADVRHVWIDECGFNIWTARSQGRARVGERAVRIVEGQRGKNVTVCLAVSEVNGLDHSIVMDGAMTQEKFSEFVTELSVIYDEPLCLIMDNARPHAELPELQRADQTYQRLPRYSPFLNITERANSCMKADLKRRLTDPEVQRTLYDRNNIPPNTTLKAHRSRILKDQLELSLPSITGVKCAGFLRETLRYAQPCLLEEDIFH